MIQAVNGGDRCGRQRNLAPTVLPSKSALTYFDMDRRMKMWRENPKELVEEILLEMLTLSIPPRYKLRFDGGEKNNEMSMSFFCVSLFPACIVFYMVILGTRILEEGNEL